MTELDNRDQYDRIYYRDGGICQTCGKYVAYGIGQRAHRVAKSKANIKRYGIECIHHDRNMVLTCPGACNDRANIGFKTAIADELMASIREEIENA